jgi:hypothetical protein
MRLVIAALIMIVLASFYHVQLSDLFSLSQASESRVYRLGIFWAAAAVLSAFYRSRKFSFSSRSKFQTFSLSATIDAPEDICETITDLFNFIR